MNLSNRIVSIAQEAAEWRRDIHAHPELAYEERRTAEVVAERLRSFGLDEVHTDLGVTGVVGVLHGADGAGEGEEKALLLRADMDALPIHEESGVPHASQTDGVMHACGHDGHTAMLLGAAKSLSETRSFSGTVYFCFQPAEEGGAGAEAMIKDGLFERFPCRAVYGMHNWPGIPAGAFAIRPGAMMARADQFQIEVVGQGGHAALPHLSRDPVVAAANIVVSLQSVVARVVDPLQPAVLSVTTVNGGDAFNVIPDRVRLGGTVRSFDDEVHEEIYERVDAIVRQVSSALGVEARLERSSVSYPPTVNDPDQTAFAASVARGVASDGSVDIDCPPTPGGEDFSYMAREKPGAFIFLGAGESHPRLHTAGYDFNDEVIAAGIAYWDSLVKQGLPPTGA